MISKETTKKLFHIFDRICTCIEEGDFDDAHYIADSNRTALMKSLDGGKDVKGTENLFQLN